MNSALPRMLQPVASEARQSWIRGVWPIASMMSLRKFMGRNEVPGRRTKTERRGGRARTQRPANDGNNSRCHKLNPNAGWRSTREQMDRRHLLVTGGALVVAPLLGLAFRGGTSRAAGSSEIRGALRRLTEPGTGDNRATFMPGGKTLLFASKRSGTSQIWRMDRDGGHPKRIHESDANDYGRVASNSDGSRLCFSSDRSGENAVYVLERATGNITLISDLSFWSFGPTWSTRDLIAFFSKKGGNAINIWTARPDGSEARQITDQPGESRQPWWSAD